VNSLKNENIKISNVRSLVEVLKEYQKFYNEFIRIKDFESCIYIIRYRLNVYEDKLNFYRLRITASSACGIIKKYDNNINKFYKLIEKLYVPGPIQHFTSMHSKVNDYYCGLGNERNALSLIKMMFNTEIKTVNDIINPYIPFVSGNPDGLILINEKN
jgi:hypothetical protein